MEDHAGRRTPILSYGMGVESTGILVRWILEPSCRDFELSDLIVVTAQTGHEFADTKECVEVYLLPLLRAHGVRWVQIARAGNSSTDGIVVLADTRSPETAALQALISWATNWRRLAPFLKLLMVSGSAASNRRVGCSIRGSNKNSLGSHFAFLSDLTSTRANALPATAPLLER